MKSLPLLLLGCIPLAIGAYLGYEYSFWSPLYLSLVGIYFVVASITTFDIRLTQAKWDGQDFGTLSDWTGIFVWIQWGLFIALGVLNWRLAIWIFVVKFILKVLPVSETIGNILMAPFKPKKSVDEL
ncbi:MAG: hypothetical protein ABIP80_04160 [Ferruginibacter sp.]